MSLRRLLPVLTTCLVVLSARAEEKIGIPYNTVNKTMQLLESRKIGETVCVPFYLKDSRKDTVFDPKVAKLRIRTWDGDEHPLDRIDVLADLDPAVLNKNEKEFIQQGYTHRIWIPKDDKRFLDGSLLHSLPKGVLEMTQGLMLSNKKE